MLNTVPALRPILFKSQRIMAPLVAAVATFCFVALKIGHVKRLLYFYLCFGLPLFPHLTSLLL